jgi:hypothetical protein
LSVYSDAIDYSSRMSTWDLDVTRFHWHLRASNSFVPSSCPGSRLSTRWLWQGGWAVTTCKFIQSPWVSTRRARPWIWF